MFHPFAEAIALPQVLYLKRILAAIIVLLWLAAPTSACSVPVFRYALDRWAGDAYRLRTPALESLPPALAAKLRALDAQSATNITIDPSMQGAAAELLFPPKPGGTAWSGTLDEKSLDAILRSPVRREIARRLCQGDSAVWILIEGADAAANDRVFALLDGASREAAKTIALPPQDAGDPQGQIGPGPELKVKFSTIRLARNAAGEAATVTMLEGSQSDAAAHRDQPIACLVFGRGHVLGAMSEKELSKGNIGDTCDLICGECSCEIKDQHPGWDLLMDLDWDAELQKVDDQRHNDSTQPAVADAQASGAAAPTTRQSALKPQTVEIHGAAPVVAPAETFAGKLGGRTTLAIVGGVGALIVLLVLARRRGESK